MACCGACVRAFRVRCWSSERRRVEFVLYVLAALAVLAYTVWCLVRVVDAYQSPAWQPETEAVSSIPPPVLLVSGFLANSTATQQSVGCFIENFNGTNGEVTNSSAPCYVRRCDVTSPLASLCSLPGLSLVVFPFPFDVPRSVAFNVLYNTVQYSQPEYVELGYDLLIFTIMDAGLFNRSVHGQSSSTAGRTVADAHRLHAARLSASRGAHGVSSRLAHSAHGMPAHGYHRSSSNSGGDAGVGSNLGVESFVGWGINGGSDVSWYRLSASKQMFLESSLPLTEPTYRTIYSYSADLLHVASLIDVVANETLLGNFTGGLIFTFLDEFIQVQRQYVQYDWLYLLTSVGGAISLAKLGHLVLATVVLRVLRSCHRRRSRGSASRTDAMSTPLQVGRASSETIAAEVRRLAVMSATLRRRLRDVSSQVGESFDDFDDGDDDDDDDSRGGESGAAYPGAGGRIGNGDGRVGGSTAAGRIDAEHAGPGRYGGVAANDAAAAADDRWSTY